MSKSKIIYQNWIVELGYDPLEKETIFSSLEQFSLEELISTGLEFSEENSQTTSQIIEKAVRNAIDKLDDEEKEFIIRFHFMGESYAELSKLTNRDMHKLTAMHKRALKKLKNNLKDFVKKHYRIKVSPKNSMHNL